MDDFSIRRLSAATTGLLDRVAPGVFDDPVVPELLTAYLAGSGNLMVLATAGGVVIGRVAAVVHQHVDKPADLYVDELTVADGFRRRGVARLLIAAVSAWAVERGCADCWLAAEADNATAQALYAQLGAAKPCVLYYWSLDDD